MASGIAARLHWSGFEVVMTETEEPTTIRRYVAFSRAVYEGVAEIEGITARLAESRGEMERILGDGEIPVVVDAGMCHADWYRADVVVDAILAKRNLGTDIRDADIVIGVGPGFTAGEDCHYVVETKRGHTLGKVITEGAAIPDTGIPGMVGGYAAERIIRASADGSFEPRVHIGDCVKKGEVVARSGNVPICAQMDGIVRGMLPEGIRVHRGMKCGDIDARCNIEHCFTISDKARAIGGGVLEAVLRGISAKGSGNHGIV